MTARTEPLTPRETALATLIHQEHQAGATWAELGPRLGLDQYVYAEWMVEGIWYDAIWRDFHARPSQLRHAFRWYWTHWARCDDCEGPEAYLHLDQVLTDDAWLTMRDKPLAAAA